MSSAAIPEHPTALWSAAWPNPAAQCHKQPQLSRPSCKLPWGHQDPLLGTEQRIKDGWNEGERQIRSEIASFAAGSYLQTIHLAYESKEWSTKPPRLFAS